MQQKYSFISVEESASDLRKHAKSQEEESSCNGVHAASANDADSAPVQPGVYEPASASQEDACSKLAPCDTAIQNAHESQRSAVVENPAGSTQGVNSASQAPTSTTGFLNPAQQSGLAQDYLELKEDLESVPPMPKVQKVVLLCLICFVFGFAVYQFIIHQLLQA